MHKTKVAYPHTHRTQDRKHKHPSLLLTSIVLWVKCQIASCYPRTPSRSQLPDSYLCTPWYRSPQSSRRSRIKLFKQLSQFTFTHLQVLVQLRAPRILHAVTRPQFLLHGWWPGEHHGVVHLSIIGVQWTRRMQCALLDVVNEGDVVSGMPIQRVKHRVKVHSVQQLVDWSQYLESQRLWVLCNWVSSGWRENFQEMMQDQEATWKTRSLLYLGSVLLRTAVADVQRTTYKVILHINDEERVRGTNNLEKGGGK